MVLQTISSAITLVLLAYVDFKRKYFTIQGSLRGISSQCLLGNLLRTGIIGRGESLQVVRRQWQENFLHVSGLNTSVMPCSVTNPWFRRAKVNNYLSAFVDSTDPLLARWRMREFESSFVHLNMIDQMHRWIIDSDGKKRRKRMNFIACAFQTIDSTVMNTTQLSTVLGRIDIASSPTYRRARRLAAHDLYRMMEQELQETSSIRVEPKRTSLIANLVVSLQSIREKTSGNLSPPDLASFSCSIIIVD